MKDSGMQKNSQFHNLVCELLFLSLFEHDKLTKAQYQECIELLKNKEKASNLSN